MRWTRSEVNAFGYLLKPVSKERLAKTLDRYRHRIEHGNGQAEPPVSPHAAAALPETASVRSSLYVKMLGSLELYDKENNLVTWRTKKAKEMFAFLWHHNGEPVQRYRILDELWPEVPFERAQALFHTTLYHLRNTLKQAGFPNMVMYGDERYWMRAERTDSDVERLIRLSGSEDQDGAVVSELVQLYRGDYLETEDYGWAGYRRSEQRAAYLRALEQRLPRIDRSGRESALRKMIELEPYGEAYYRMLYRDLKEAGDTAGAQALKELMVKRFQGELGLDIQMD